MLRFNNARPLLAMLAVGLCLSPALGQHDMQSAAPGQIHEMLARLAGEYTTVTKFHMQPGDKPTESTGSARITTILGGRFILEEGTANFMGQPTSSLRLLGYNNDSKQYEGIWTYTMSTAIMRMTGTSTDGGKTIRFAANWDGGGGAKQTLDVTTRLIDNDHFVTELAAKLPDGKPGPTLVSTYTRKQ